MIITRVGGGVALHLRTDVGMQSLNLNLTHAYRFSAAENQFLWIFEEAKLDRIFAKKYNMECIFGYIM